MSYIHPLSEDGPTLPKRIGENGGTSRKKRPLVVSELCYLAKWWVFLTYIKWQLDICWDFPVAVCGIYQLQGEWNGWMDGFSREDEDLIDVAMEQTGAWPRRWLKGFQFFRLFARRDHKSLLYFLRCRMVRGAVFLFFCFLLARSQRNVTWISWIDGTGVANGQWFGWLSWHLKGSSKRSFAWVSSFVGIELERFFWCYSKILLKIVTQ